jgi:hypothetical protein
LIKLQRGSQRSALQKWQREVSSSSSSSIKGRYSKLLASTAAGEQQQQQHLMCSSAAGDHVLASDSNHGRTALHTTAGYLVTGRSRDNCSSSSSSSSQQLPSLHSADKHAAVLVPGD